jgi:rhamnopyranosyl-N-acetylglucosaminyl-diphospho-decaprenol beta-1,3/1,4-galactofuranosyltransferase
VAVECLRLLSIQTQRPGKLFVTDNASTDGTAEALEAASREYGLALNLIRCPENLGNAGGIKVAMEKAFEEGFAVAWVLDDDSWPEERALQELVECDAPEDGIRTSIVLSPDSNQVSWPCEIIGKSSHWEALSNVTEVPAKSCIMVRRSWLGALIPHSAYNRVGQLNGELFLRGEDEDYPRRLGRAGYQFWMATASILRHPLAGPIVSITFGDHKVWLEYHLNGDKLYYRIRNMIWIKKNESGFLSSLLLTTGYLFLLLRWFRPLIPVLKLLKEAAADAFLNRLGKRQELGL